jgi:hypothetical protein
MESSLLDVLHEILWETEMLQFIGVVYVGI